MYKRQDQDDERQILLRDRRLSGNHISGIDQIYFVHWSPRPGSAPEVRHWLEIRGGGMAPQPSTCAGVRSWSVSTARAEVSPTTAPAVKFPFTNCGI